MFVNKTETFRIKPKHHNKAWNVTPKKPAIRDEKISKKGQSFVYMATIGVI